MDNPITYGGAQTTSGPLKKSVPSNFQLVATPLPCPHGDSGTGGWRGVSASSAFRYTADGGAQYKALVRRWARSTSLMLATLNCSHIWLQYSRCGRTIAFYSRGSILQLIWVKLCLIKPRALFALPAMAATCSLNSMS